MAKALRWYMDEHVPLAVAEGLCRRRVDVLTTQDAAMLGVSDEQQLAYATNADRVIFTQDDDFLRLAASGIVHAGIAYAPQGTPIGSLVRGLLLVTDVYTAEEMINHVEYL